MRMNWRLQFKLRTLLVMMLVLGPAPWVVVQFRQQRQERELWQRLDYAQQGRDQALTDWRKVYDAYTQGRVPVQEEAAQRERYFSYRAEFESARSAIEARYEGDEDRILSAANRFGKGGQSDQRRLQHFSK